MTIDTNPEKIDTLLSRGVSEIIGGDELRAKLASGKRLRIKLGIDPTSPHIHLGRVTALRKLRDFQELGHQIVFIIGDFTGTIGDTSDKDAERPMLDQRTVEENLTTYIAQVGKILDIENCEIHRNSTWLMKLNFAEVGHLADAFSVNDFISRELIKKRLDGGTRVSLREVLYPLMQGYDSVAIDADVEIGGTDQRFNLLAGRELQRQYHKEPQAVLMLPLVEGTDGRKMSSSWGNTINLTDTPDDMFGKVMSIRDELIIRYFVSMTRVSMDLVSDYKQELSAGTNPKEIKLKLAEAIVTLYYDEALAHAARANWENTFSKGGLPDTMPEVTVAPGTPLMDAVLIAGLVESKSDWRRLVDAGGIKLENDEKVTDTNATLTTDTLILKIGKHRFLKIIAH